MEFYFRNKQLKELEVLGAQSVNRNRMSVLIGRRRVGKTSLAFEFIKDKRQLYLFVANKSEALLCQGFVDAIKRDLNITIHGKFESFIEIFTFLMDYTQKHQLTLVIDELQRIYSTNPAVFSEIQELWDQRKKQTKMHVIYIGTVCSMMTRIFEDEKEPLLGRADRVIRLRPFSILEMKKLLEDHGVDDLERLFLFYIITGCVPKHHDLLLKNRCGTLPKILDFMLQENSPFIHEGKNQLIEEFGKEYTMYFSILELIARGKASKQN